MLQVRNGQTLGEQTPKQDQWDSKGGAMATTSPVATDSATTPTCAWLGEPAWYAVQTRSRHEHLVACHLASRGIVEYLPTFFETHVWSDRRKKIEVPLFPGYIFVQIKPLNEHRVQVLRAPGVVRLVGSEPGGTPIPSEQIQYIRTLIDQNLPWNSHPFLKVGQRVRIRGGALDGMEGIFTRRSGIDTLVISVDAIQRSLSITIQGYALDVF
jgi:transcription antitermination factor NusG